MGAERVATQKSESALCFSLSMTTNLAVVGLKFPAERVKVRELKIKGEVGMAAVNGCVVAERQSMAEHKYTTTPRFLVHTPARQRGRPQEQTIRGPARPSRPPSPSAAEWRPQPTPPTRGCAKGEEGVEVYREVKCFKSAIFLDAACLQYCRWRCVSSVCKLRRTAQCYRRPEPRPED